MRIAMTLLTFALVIGSAACKKKQPATTDNAGSGSAMAGSDTGSAMAGSDTGSGAGSAEMTKKAGNCPSTVLGATTTAEVKGTEVVVTISSEDKNAAQAIQKRAEALLAEKADGGTGGAHDQKGTHGGGMGICPVFFGEGGTAKSVKDAKGVVITITPKVPPAELKAAIDERINKSADWVKNNIKPGDSGNTGGVGGGAGDHGSTHQGEGDAKGKERKEGKEGGTGGGEGTGGGGQKGTGGGGDKAGKASKASKADKADDKGGW